MNYLPYYGVCASLWFIAWAVGLWYFQSRRNHGPLLRQCSWPQRICFVVFLLAIPVVYACSYPLYQRLVAAFPNQRNWLGPLEDLYVPMQFLQSPDWSFEPLLYPLALLAIVLVPLVIHRGVFASGVRHPGIVGALFVGILATACFLFMLGPT